MDNYEEKSKVCSFCGEELPAYSRRCPYCGCLTQKENAEKKTDTDHSEVPADQAETSMNPDVSPEGESFSADDGRTVQTDPVCDAAPGNEKVKRVFDLQQTGISQSSITAVKPLGNRLKVFLTTLSVIIPGLGQLVGIIASIIFMNSDNDEDRRSFGSALMVSSLIVFVVELLFYFMLILGFSALVNKV